MLHRIEIRPHLQRLPHGRMQIGQIEVFQKPQNLDIFASQAL